jgi:dolichyl-phosphooligosaccharide-protein glycotransferase
MSRLAGEWRGKSLLQTVLAWLSLFAAAIAARVSRLGLVFADGEVHFPGGADELYHLRRIWFTVQNFPASLEFDYYVNHPVGAAPVWPPSFDWAIAALARAIVGRGDQHAVEVVAAWVPPVIGSLAVLAAAGLARRAFSPAAGWATGALLAVLPAHVFHSALGEVDHHVAVGLMTTLLLATAMGQARQLCASGRPLGAIGTGISAAAAILLWPGALLHVLVVQGFFVIQLLATRERGIAIARARSLAALHAAAMLAMLPWSAGRTGSPFGVYSPLVLSQFQLLWFAAGAAVLASAAGLWSFPALGANRARRIGAAIAPAALVLSAAWFLMSGLDHELREAGRWFEADPFFARIAELLPLLISHNRFDPSLAHELFSPLFWVYPLAVAGLGWQALARRRADVLLLLTASLAFYAEALNQTRFVDVFAIGFALVIGPAFVEVLRVARDQFHLPFVARGSAALLVCAVGLAAPVPQFGRDAVRSADALRGAPPLDLAPSARLNRILQRVARWLKQHSPPTRGFLNASQRPEYGVLCAWGHGHLLRYYAERPMVQDNFGPWGGQVGFDAARRYYESRDEAEAAAIADRLEARYVIAMRVGSGQARPEQDSLARRLVPALLSDGTMVLPGSPANALTRHRLLMVEDDTDLVRGSGAQPWIAAVYELVPGALVVGRAPGESAVLFELEVPLPGRLPLRYQAAVRVDGSGGYQIRLPYPSEQGYAVRTDSYFGSLRISEGEVREGRTVLGPSIEQ